MAFDSQAVKRLGAALCVCLVIIVYAILAGWDIMLPGISYDSSNFGWHSYCIYKSNYHFLDLMIHPREGVQDAYPISVLFRFFDNPVEALRYGCVLINVLALLIFYSFCRNLFKSQMFALAALGMLATHPGFINASRSASWSNFNIFLPVSAALWAFERWYVNGRSLMFYLGIFFLGVSVGTRIHSIWIINTLISVFFILGMQRRFKNVSSAALALAAGTLSFCAGAWNLVLYNFRIRIPGFHVSFPQEYFLTAKNIFSDVTNNPYMSSNSAWYAVKTMASNLLDVLSANNYLNMIESQPGFAGGWLFVSVYVFAAVLAVTVFLSVFKGMGGNFVSKRSRVLVLSFIICFVQGFISPQFYPTYQLYILIPLEQVIIVSFLKDISELLSKVPLGNYLFNTVVALIVSQNLVFWGITKKSIEITGGGGHHSDAIYRLANWLQDNKKYNLVAVDWGISLNIRFLTKGRVSPVELFVFMNKKEWNDELKAKWQKIISDKNNVFVFYARPRDDSKSNRRKFYSLLKSSGMAPVKVIDFFRRNGDVIYRVVRLKSSGSAGGS